MAMDITKLCRSCKKEVASWEKENFDAQVVKMFCFSTNIEITEGDKLPKQFCYDCVIKIESSYTFIKEAQNVNVTLKNMVSRRERSIIVELENSTRPTTGPSTSKNHLNLTLPDYKLSSTIESSEEPLLINNTNESIDLTNDNIPPDPKTQNLINNPPESNVESKDIKHDKNQAGDEKHMCTTCKKSFTSQVWLAKHMEKEHSGQEYHCTQCNKTFTKPSQLAYHATTHSNERKFGCNLCNKTFKRLKQLTVHVRSHSDERPYCCDKCQKRFKLKSILKCHMNVHEGRKQYLCNYCGWAFAQAGNLSVHIRRHTGCRPHACGECEYRAAAGAALRRHARRHRPEVPAPTLLCAHCSQQCKDSSALARHMRTHTGELPYQCGRCQRAFSDSWKRKTHLMRAHGLALHEIPRLSRDGTPYQPQLSKHI
ncbi:PREDICTED: zinc finger protein 771-like [Papilio xuthus]|uniref:Zinc finger protein 771-like n=1 Tax=Papilio xuthus TaxID=66420 RepID=A0AAJ6Z6Z7_PAPXU|nr:PREDICTED: zinc finger protein 771-like [Papilio xuthus]